jgi:hypothetical protein
MIQLCLFIHSFSFYTCEVIGGDVTTVAGLDKWPLFLCCNNFSLISSVGFLRLTWYIHVTALNTKVCLVG